MYKGQEKINQEERILVRKCKTAITKLEQQKEMEKKKDVKRKCTSIKEVSEQTKILLEQTKTKLKNLYQEKETSKEIIKEIKEDGKNKNR